MIKKSKNTNKVISRDFSKKKRRNLLGKVLYWLCLLAFIGGVVYALFFSPFVMISEINISGTKDLDNDSIKEFVRNEIGGKYFNIVGKNSFLLLKKDILEKALGENFKKIEKVKVEKKFPNKINITISEREEVVALCSNGQCFIVDEKGIAYSQIDLNNSADIDEHLLILQNENGRDIKLGDFVFDADYAQYLLDIKDKLESDLGITIERELTTVQLISGDIHAKTTEGWLIYFDKNIPIEKEIKMLGLVLKDKLKDVRHEDIEYIDLRADNKIYYKLKNIQPEENKTEDPSPQPVAKNKKDKN